MDDTRKRPWWKRTPTWLVLGLLALLAVGFMAGSRANVGKPVKSRYNYRDMSTRQIYDLNNPSVLAVSPMDWIRPRAAK